MFLLRHSHVCEGNDGWSLIVTTIGCNNENKFGFYDMTCRLKIRVLFLANVD